MTKINQGTQDKHRRLVAVVVTCNRLDKLKLTVSRLCASAPRHLASIIIVDNASSDGTGDWLASQQDPRIDVIPSKENLGGAGGFALGMARALSTHDPDWLVVMDDDGRPEVGALEAFHDINPEQNNWAGIAAAVYYPDGNICDMNRPSQNPFWHKAVFLRSLIGFGGRDGFHIGPERYEATDSTDIDITSFVGFFVSATVARKVALPDPRLFIYGDDGLYSLGLSKQNHKLVFHPAIRFEHDCSTFVPGEAQTFTPLWKAYYYHRNLLILYRAAAGWLFWPLLLLILPKWFLKGRNHPGSRRMFYKLMRRAVWDGLRNERTMTHDAVVQMSNASVGNSTPPAK